MNQFVKRLETDLENFGSISNQQYPTTEIENNQSHFHDIGYRFLPEFWNQGFAKEAAKPCVEYGFNVLNLSKIIGTCHINNIASKKVLEHCGLKEMGLFTWENLPCRWMEIYK